MELEKIEEFRKIILEHPEESKEDFDVLYDIFFNQIPQLQISKMIDDTKTVGGKGKEIAVRDIVEKLDLDFSSGDKIIYAGDSITDVEPLEYAKNHGGLAVSFNGNEYPLAVVGLIFIPFILVQDKEKYAHIAELAEKAMFFITLAIIIIAFIWIYTPMK